MRKMVAAAGSDVDSRKLLASVGIDERADPDPKLMVADTAYYSLLEEMARHIDVTDLPLRTGASMRCDNYGALGLAFKAAPTLNGSYARVARYARLWTSVVEYQLELEGENTWFTLHRAGVRRLGLRLSNEATLASATALAREVTSSGRFAPLEVHLQHLPPKDTSYHSAYFGCPVCFESDRDALLISRTSMNAPNKLGDAAISQFLIGHLDQELAESTGAGSLRDALRDAIARSLSEGLPKMDDVARRLGMSARSLHRRLAADGLSFQALTDQTRRELAEGLLRDERYSLSEVAFLTGFSEQSAFTRAFKRWAGDTPAAYRKAQV
ncbi:MAG: AraC family transcriptional regulator [Pseudomonadota bacterium]